jgi:hypothetical protein
MFVRPTFQVTFLEAKQEMTEIRGKMSRPPGELGHVGMYIPPATLVEAQLIRYEEKDQLATFTVSSRGSKPSIEVGDTLEFVAGGDVLAATIVLDTDITWRETVFKRKDSIVTTIDGNRCVTSVGPDTDLNNLPEGATLVKGTWDHEHCILCWQCICEDCGPEAAISSDNFFWVCKKCYAEYVIPKSIDFQY